MRMWNLASSSSKEITMLRWCFVTLSTFWYRYATMHCFETTAVFCFPKIPKNVLLQTKYFNAAYLTKCVYLSKALIIIMLYATTCLQLFVYQWYIHNLFFTGVCIQLIWTSAERECTGLHIREQSTSTFPCITSRSVYIYCSRPSSISQKICPWQAYLPCKCVM